MMVVAVFVEYGSGGDDAKVAAGFMWERGGECLFRVRVGVRIKKEVKVLLKKKKKTENRIT